MTKSHLPDSDLNSDRIKAKEEKKKKHTVYSTRDLHLNQMKTKTNTRREVR